MSARAWFTVREVALLLHVGRLTAWRLLRPYRERCHLAREGSHPRLVLWIPGAVVTELRRERRDMWRGRFHGEPSEQSGA